MRRISQSGSFVFLDPLRLTNGRCAWLEQFEDPTEPVEPETVPAGQVVRVLSPEDGNASCPGFLLVGMHVSAEA